MAATHVFVETNFLFGVFRMPSMRSRDALALKARLAKGEVKLYVPYLCFQEARHLIAKSLPSNRCTDLFEFHRFSASTGTADWSFDEVKKFLDAATGEVTRTKSAYKRDLAEFAESLGDGLLHGTKEVFEFLESLDLDEDTLEYNDRLIFSSVIVKAKELRGSSKRIFFASLDKKHLQPTDARPKMRRSYVEAGITFVPGFDLPRTTTASS